MIRIGVCDDNAVFLQNLSKIIEDTFRAYTDNFNVMSYTQGTLLLDAHNQEQFDVIFLDIDMPETTGFDVAKMLRDDFSSCFIVFVTNHSELVYESMDFQPFHFIRKNFSTPIEESVERTVKKLMKHMKQNEKIVLEDDVSGRCGVYIRDIIYIESDSHYVKYHIKGKAVPIRMRIGINECEEKYREYDFVRIHKRYLLNIRYLSQFDNRMDEVLIGLLNVKLPMSKNYKKDVDEKYTLYLRSKA